MNELASYYYFRYCLRWNNKLSSQSMRFVGSSQWKARFMRETDGFKCG